MVSQPENFNDELRVDESHQQQIMPVELPYSFAKRHGLIVTQDQDKTCLIYKTKPALNIIAECRRFIGHNFELIACHDYSDKSFDALLAESYDRGNEATASMVDDLGSELDLSDIADTLQKPEDLLESEDDAPIIRLINALLSQAIKENASDIHIEPFENRLLVRFRVDGVLHEVLEPPRELTTLIVSRIKVMARLDIAEKRLPQDGRISLLIAGRTVDVRVSTLPSGHGERVVMRLLDKQAGRLDLSHLGMNPITLKQISHLIKQPHGIFLVTGPTGSGKTTTLYAALTQINDLSRNILTVEDPIEYYLDGIGQTQVNTKVDLSFARGLRAILRQDPDVVMIGEIRDKETAEIAVQASLTGHLVFSTLHTNTAINAISRLRDIGVEPFLLSSSLIGSLAQRLIRTLCDNCKEPYIATDTECEIMGISHDEAPTLYRAKGCDHCNHLGFNGRTGIHELIIVDEKMKSMIHDGASEQKMEKHARQSTQNIREDGIQKVLQGISTLDEVLRVTQND